MPVEAAMPADEPAIRQLLASSGLPTDDWSADLTGASVVIRDNAGIAGVGAIERRGNVGLLRSVAIAKRIQGSGLGYQIVDALEARAREEHLNALYLLTTTARDYFQRLGYRVLSREKAPAGIRSTAQFGSLCPSSSTLMVKSMTDKVYNVLFLCTGNSARSILGEAILNHVSNRGGQFRGFSAGSHPKDHPNPFALELLHKNGIPTADLRSKSWDEFAKPGAPQLDFVFTVCDQAAGEQCPYWPGQPMTAHWGMPDPAGIEGSDDAKRKAFADTFIALRRRLDLFTSLPMHTLDNLALINQIKEIGQQ